MTLPQWEEQARTHRLLSRVTRFTVLLAVAIFLLQVALKMQAWRLTRAVTANRATWAGVEEEAESLMEGSRRLRSLQGFVAELEGWRDSQNDWYPVLDLARTSAPPNLDLRRIIVRQTLSATNRLPEGSTNWVEVAFRQSYLQLQGEASGNQGPADIADFVTQMSKHPLVKRDFLSFKLQGFKEEPGADPAQRENGFSIKAVTAQKEMP